MPGCNYSSLSQAITVFENKVLYSRTLPNAYSQGSRKKHVEELFHFITQFEAESLAHDDVPAGAELLVQDLLDRLGALQRNSNERVCCSIVAEMLVSGVSAILWQFG